MIGFIKKDLAMIKSNFKLMGILLFFYVVMGLLGEMDISFILPFMSVMIMISTFSYDNYNKWDAYSVTLPNGRKNESKIHRDNFHDSFCCFYNSSYGLSDFLCKNKND